MSQFLYFVPPKEGVGCDQAYLQRIGLGDRVRYDAGRREMVGPAGNDVRGLCFCRDPERIAFKADGQMWSSPFEDGRYWIGYWLDDPPTPETLARDQLIAAQAVTLADGNEWYIPAARVAPRIMRCRNGQVMYRDTDVGERLWAHADRLLEYWDFLKAAKAFQESDDSESTPPVPPHSDAEMLRIAADGLTVNYRVSSDPAEEISLLELFTTHNIHDVLQAMISLREPVADDAKKNEPEPAT